MTQMLKQFASARAVGTPLIGIRSADPENTMAAIQRISKDVPIVMWNCISGARHRNEAGEESLNAALDGADITATQNATEMTDMASKLFSGTILFMINAHRFLDRHDFTQALWNLRDVFKSSERTIVLLGPEFQFPAELQQDVLVLDEPLPDEEELKAIVKETVCAAELPAKVIASIDVNRAVDALRGLAAFPAEQATAMSISPEGLDIEGLWERKRQLIQQTDGISVWNEGIKFSDIGGIEEAKRRARRIINGRNPYRVVVWIDEGEKAMAGANGIGDSSGTSQDQHAIMLSEMQDRSYNGMILIGVAGGAKSVFAKALAHEAGVLLIRFDLGAMKGSLVGESERKIRQVMKIINAVGGDGGALFVMTSNDIRSIKPELKRRYRKGIWFFDLPTEKERRRIWNIYLYKFKDDGVGSYERTKGGGVVGVDDSNWTGAEIETCVTTAWEENITLQEAARSIIPVAVSGKEDVERLRREAVGKYNSASYEGAYKMPQVTEAIQPRRKFAQESK